MGSGSRRSRRSTRHHFRGGRCADAQRDLPAREPDILAAIDAELADALTTWGPLSQNKTEQAIDALVERHDPPARRRTGTAVRSRYIDVEHRGGIASVSGEVHRTWARRLQKGGPEGAHPETVGAPVGFIRVGAREFLR